jgi:GNAT superfamily N-acetyltransferase
MIVVELKTKDEMLAHIDVLNELYPNLTPEYYEQLLDQMMGNNYGQIAVMQNGICIAISGYWLGTKMWCGPYLELDNVVVRSSARGTGAGKLMQEYLQNKAMELGCHIMVLDAYKNNFKAHRFYYNQGYAPRGFHFIKILEEGKLT